MTPLWTYVLAAYLVGALATLCAAIPNAAGELSDNQMRGVVLAALAAPVGVPCLTLWLVWCMAVWLTVPLRRAK